MQNKRRINNHSTRFSIAFPILTIICIAMMTSMSSAYEENWNYNWTGIREEIKDSLKIAEYQGMTSGFVGYSARSTIYEVKRRLWIMKTATEAELLHLTTYPGGTIKAIAYEGLLRKDNFKHKTALVHQAMRDNEYTVSYQSGCLGWDLEVDEYLIECVLKLEGPIFLKQHDFGISTSDEEIILAAYKLFKTSNDFKHY